MVLTKPLGHSGVSIELYDVKVNNDFLEFSLEMTKLEEGVKLTLCKLNELVE